MHKDELLQLYSLFCQIHDHLMKTDEAYQANADNKYFERYEELEIPNVPVRVSKKVLKEGIFLQGRAIATTMDAVKYGKDDQGYRAL